MIPYEDVLLELDLREVFGAERPPDVWPALASRLQGAARARLRLLPGRRRRRRGHLVPWAVAAALLLGLGALWLAQGPSGEPTTTGRRPPTPPPPTPGPSTPPAVPEPREPLGRVEGDVMVARADGTIREDDRVEAGERVAVGPHGARIRLRDGATIRVDGEAWLALDASDEALLVHLARGALEVETAAHAVRIDAGPGPLEVEPGARCSLVRRERPPAEHPTTWLGGFATPRPADLVCDVVKGRAVADGLSASAGRLVVWLRGLAPREGPALPDELRAWLDERLAAVDEFATVDPGSEAGLAADKRAQESAGELRRRLDEAPEGWPYAVPWLERRVADLDEDAAARVALRVLVHDPDLRALEAVHARLAKLGTDARPGELLPLAERSDDPVAIDLLQRGLRDRTSVFDVYPAAFFALRGDDVGRAVLEQIVAQPNRLDTDPVSVFAAAAGLARLGSPEHWDALRTNLAERIQTALADDRPQVVRWPLTAASYFAPVVRGGRPVSVDDISRKVSEHGQTLKLETPDEIRALLRSLP